MLPRIDKASFIAEVKSATQEASELKANDASVIEVSRIPSERTSINDLTAEEKGILSVLSININNILPTNRLADLARLSEVKTEYFARSLTKKGLLNDYLVSSGPRRYGLSDLGKDFIVENNLAE
ncbi:hypothetical protein [Thiohalophilus sp.]|uniref:hypothetical protein n=1 Tax=Thiohalophilus sp. TaxID=3028392 RepID=UPI002ACE3D54|nr:hypothetical protein [Thiohalophilus sp.]MDZ7662948.1 hypothetical protein [Thiohalophilus sp.]